MQNFSFLNFQYGRSTKPQKKFKPQTFTNFKTSLSSKNETLITPSLSSRNPNSSELRWAFDKFDANKDGKISREEYTSALKSLDKDISDSEIARAFKTLDSDSDGFIVFTEFVEMFKSNGETKVEDVESAFRVFDIDGDGKISAEELSQVMRRIGEGNCSVKACRDMVKGVDSDGDGLINLEEFKRMMSSSSNSKKLIIN